MKGPKKFSDQFVWILIKFDFIAGCNGSGCGYPGAPAHSIVRFTVPGTQDVIDEEDALLKDRMLSVDTVATYYCERGFELLGPARRQCQADGSWLPEGVPFCGEFANPSFSTCHGRF